MGSCREMSGRETYQNGKRSDIQVLGLFACVRPGKPDSRPSLAERGDAPRPARTPLMPQDRFQNVSMRTCGVFDGYLVRG
jgi:hypothetical protein